MIGVYYYLADERQAHAEYSDLMEYMPKLLNRMRLRNFKIFNEKLSIFTQNRYKNEKKKYLDPLKISIDHSYSEYPRIYLISLNMDEFYSN